MASPIFDLSEFRTIPMFDDYKINRDGVVLRIYRNKKIKKLKPYVHTSGYLMVDFKQNHRRKHLRLHRLLADLFLPNPLKLPIVNHKNSVITDDRVDNLEWVSHLSNRVDSRKTGKKTASKYLGVSWHAPTKTWHMRYTVDGVRHSGGYFHDEIEAAKAYDTIVSKIPGLKHELNFPDHSKPKIIRSKYIGITPSGSRWRARYDIDGKKTNVGIFATEIEAAKARDEAVKKYIELGHPFKLNFP